jgi:large subunit ribosomal protein L29
MGLPKFKDILELSNSEIAESILKFEKELFNLQFRKATRQSFKSHEIKMTKHKLAQLKTLLTLRLELAEKTTGNTLL